MYLAIDPGIHTGWCVVSSGGLVVACGKGEDFPVRGHRGAIVECPQIYRASKSKGDPNNLITLAVRVGRYQERLLAAEVPCELVLPTTWKGQIPKDVHHRRVNVTLTPGERQIVSHVAKTPTERGYSEDVWDAVALGKWLRRFAIAQNVR